MSSSVVQMNFENYFTEGPIEYIFEDDQCVAYEAIVNQIAPTHFVVVPKRVIPLVTHASKEDEKLLGHLLVVAKNLALERGLQAYHVIVDEDHKAMRLNGVHFFGRTMMHMLWPTGPGSRL